MSKNSLNDPLVTDPLVVAQREEQINCILVKNTIDLESLHAVSRLPGGFLNNSIRSRVWPRIFDIKSQRQNEYSEFINFHQDGEQVRADVERSLWNYKEIASWEEEQILQKRQSLSNIIMAILCKHSNFHYYQGYHDVVSVFLLVLDDDKLAFAVAEAASFQFFSDCLNKTFDVASKVISFVMHLIKSADRLLHQYLLLAHVEPFFATSWLITWFAHDIKSYHQAARVYDVLLCSHPVYCLYLCAALVLHFRQQVFQCECDFAIIHNLLVNIPKKFGIPLEEIIPIADSLYESVPPSKLKKMATGELKTLLSKNRVKMFAKKITVTPRDLPSSPSLTSRLRSLSLGAPSLRSPGFGSGKAGSGSSRRGVLVGLLAGEGNDSKLDGSPDASSRSRGSNGSSKHGQTPSIREGDEAGGELSPAADSMVLGLPSARNAMTEAKLKRKTPDNMPNLAFAYFPGGLTSAAAFTPLSSSVSSGSQPSRRPTRNGNSPLSRPTSASPSPSSESSSAKSQASGSSRGSGSPTPRSPARKWLNLLSFGLSRSQSWSGPGSTSRSPGTIRSPGRQSGPVSPLMSGRASISLPSLQVPGSPPNDNDDDDDDDDGDGNSSDDGDVDEHVDDDSNGLPDNHIATENVHDGGDLTNNVSKQSFASRLASMFVVGMLLRWWQAIIAYFSQRTTEVPTSTSASQSILKSQANKKPYFNSQWTNTKQNILRPAIFGKCRLFITFVPRILVAFWSVVMLDGLLAAIKQLPELCYFEWSKKTV